MKVRQNIGMVFQHFHLFPHMTVLKNVTHAPLKVKHISHDQARQEGLELLAKVGLSDKADVYPSKLSGGQKQRVASLHRQAPLGHRTFFSNEASNYVIRRTNISTRSRNGERSVGSDERLD